MAPFHASNKLIKLNGINFFRKKIKEEAISEDNFNATKYHLFNILYRPQHVENRHPEGVRDFRRKKIVPGRFYAEVSTSSPSSTPNGNKRIVTLGECIVSFKPTIKQNLNKHIELSRAAVKCFTGAKSRDLAHCAYLRCKKDATNK